jgi:chromosome segregation ATPase
MTQTPRFPESLERRVSTLENNMVELRTTAEALLQTAQIHQRNFEVMAREMNEGRRNVETLAREMNEGRRQIETLISGTNESTQRFDQLHQESNQRFEIMLAELRQLRIEGELRFNGMQTEIRRIIDHLFNQGETE